MGSAVRAREIEGGLVVPADVTGSEVASAKTKRVVHHGGSGHHSLEIKDLVSNS